MSLFTSPPSARTFRDDKATLLVCWWCTCFAAVIIIFRVCGRYIRTERLFREDWLAFVCLIPLLIRQALVHVILIYGTNNVITVGLSDEEIHRRSVGSRLVLASRIFYAATCVLRSCSESHLLIDGGSLWMLKLTISEFFKRLTFTIWRRSYELTLQFIRWFLLATFIAVLIADLAECQPVSHYWQVVPDPGGSCRQGYAQLLTMGTANVITDLLLVLFPIPIIIRSKMGVTRKIQLVILFAGSLLPAGTTLFRIPKIIDRHGSQQYRSLMASIEILFATAVANALVLGSFIRDKGLKKQRWKLGSVSESVERTISRRGTVARHWGSDEDLVRDLGLGVEPELRGSPGSTPRPAPMAVAGNHPVKGQREAEPDWQFPEERSSTSEELDLIKIQEGNHTPDGASSTLTPRKVSFFDVGGLLEEDSQRRRVSSTRTTTDTDGESSSHALQWTPSYDHGLSPAPPRRGSSALLQDIGGLLGPRTQRKQSTFRSYELQTILQEQPPASPSHNASPQAQISRQQTTLSLQDVGGLLK